MAQDILQRFLTARLFDVRGEDENVAKLRETGEELAAALKESSQRIAAFAVVAIDAQVPPSEPIVGEVIGMLEKRWNSFAGVFADNQLTVVARAIILDALARLVRSDHAALAIALTARSLLPHIGSTADRELWADLLAEAEIRLEARARREWTLPLSGAGSEQHLVIAPLPPIAGPTVKRSWLQSRVEAASGPQNRQGEAVEDSNEQWPNSGAPWSYDFAPRMAKAIADAVDGVSKKLAENINQQDLAGHVVTAVSAHIAQAVDGLAPVAKVLERRTALLWWKESLYSAGANASYRDLEPVHAAAWAAVDAVDLTGPFAPRMAEAFLLETLRSAGEERASVPNPLGDVAALIAREGDGCAELRKRLSVVGVEPGMTPLAGLLSLGSSVGAAELASRAGLPTDFELTASELALWLFRDLQAAIANAAGTKSKRRAKRG